MEQFFWWCFFVSIFYVLDVYSSFKNRTSDGFFEETQRYIFLRLLKTDSTVNPSLGPLISDSRHTMAFHQLVQAYVSHNPLIRFYNWEGGMGMQIIGVVNI